MIGCDVDALPQLAHRHPPAMRVAVMQPYFFPYAGYFRLMHAADHFVVFDCVQFPRRGYVHRTQLPGPGGRIEWLTLPLAPQPRDVRIGDLAFAADARTCLDRRLARHPWLARAPATDAERLRTYLHAPLPSVIEYLVRGLQLVADILGFAPVITRSSELALDPDLRSEDRVIAVVKAVGGAQYVNAPGGRGLYHPERFAKAGLSLAFLSTYRGRYPYLLQALACEPAAAIRDDIRASTRLEP